MKKIFNYILLCGFITAGNACSKNADNYAEPSETLTGSVIDSSTGKSIQTEIGSGGVRIRLDEMSYSDNPTPFYFYSKQDGTFNNTKIFKGKYRIMVDGPFVPLLQNDNTGAITVDKRVTMDIAGTAHVDFKVQPLLKVEWVGDPVVNANGTISAGCKFSRGTNDAGFQNTVSDLFLFVNANDYAGNNNYDNRYSNHVTYSGTAGNALLGQPVSLTTTGGALPGKRSYFIRVGARTGYGLKQYNYTDVKTVVLP